MKDKPPMNTFPTSLTSVALVIVFFLMPDQLYAQNTTDTLDLDWFGPHQLLTESELLEFVPGLLSVYHFAGRIDTLHCFDAAAWPVTDSLGIRIDTLSQQPDYLFVLYNTASSVLVILKRFGDNYRVQWVSDKMAGVMGGITIRDFNGDGSNEILVGLQLGAQLRPNDFLYSWNNGEMNCLNPAGIMKGLSEFRYQVSYIETDTGTTIKTIQSGKETTYFYGKESPEIRLISEMPVDQKD